LEHNVCQGREHVLAELKRVEDLGGEGLMLRNAEAFHRAGRTPDLLKVKTQHDDEAVVEGHEPGKGKHSGLVGALLCKARNGKQFKVNPQRRTPFCMASCAVGGHDCAPRQFMM